MKDKERIIKAIIFQFHRDEREKHFNYCGMEFRFMKGDLYYIDNPDETHDEQIPCLVGDDHPDVRDIVYNGIMSYLGRSSYANSCILISEGLGMHLFCKKYDSINLSRRDLL